MREKQKNKKASSIFPFLSDIFLVQPASIDVEFYNSQYGLKI
jgi:hypothetical protein